MFGQPFVGYGSNSLEQYIAYLQDLIEQLQEQVDEDQNKDDEPELTTRSVLNISDDSATLRGAVDMNDYRNGRVFFVYGEDESDVEDIAEDFTTYADIDESGDDLQKVLVDDDLDNSASYSRTVSGLDDNTDIYYSICVEYEDADDDDVIKCGEVRSFETE